MGIKLEIETKRFQSLVRAVSINGIIETPVLRFRPNQIRVMNKDVASVVLGCGIFKDRYFINYQAEDIEKVEEIKVGFNAEKLLKISKQLSDETTEIYIRPEKNKIEMTTDTQKASVPIVESVTGEAKPVPVIVEKEDTIEFTEDYAVVEQIPVLKKEIESLGEAETRFIVKDGELSVQQETIDGYSFAQKLKKGINAEDFTLIAGSDYLSAIFSSMISNDTIEIRLNKDHPLGFVDKNENYTFVVLLAPRIEG